MKHHKTWHWNCPERGGRCYYITHKSRDNWGTLTEKSEEPNGGRSPKALTVLSSSLFICMPHTHIYIYIYIYARNFTFASNSNFHFCHHHHADQTLEKLEQSKITLPRKIILLDLACWSETPRFEGILRIPAEATIKDPPVKDLKNRHLHTIRPLNEEKIHGKYGSVACYFVRTYPCSIDYREQKRRI